MSEWSPRRSSRRHVVFVIPLVSTGGRGRDREQKVQRSDVQHQSPLAKNGKTTREWGWLSHDGRARFRWAMVRYGSEGQEEIRGNGWR